MSQFIKITSTLIVLSVFACGLIVSTSIYADGVYKVVDEDGNVTYTDDPGDQPAEKVDVQKPNVVPAVAPQSQPKRASKAAVPTSYEVKIASPEPETRLMPGEWDLTIQVATKPRLHPKHSIQISDNSQAYPAQGNSLIIKNITRGSHSITAKVLNENGKVISSSQPVTVYVMRPSVNSPARK